jgi:hypothetical protein
VPGRVDYEMTTRAAVPRVVFNTRDKEVALGCAGLAAGANGGDHADHALGHALVPIVTSRMTSDADAMNGRRRRMHGPARQLGFDMQHNAELSLATSTKPTQRSTLRMVTAFSVAGEGGRLDLQCYPRDPR